MANVSNISTKIKESFRKLMGTAKGNMGGECPLIYKLQRFMFNASGNANSCDNLLPPEPIPNPAIVTKQANIQITVPLTNTNEFLLPSTSAPRNDIHQFPHLRPHQWYCTTSSFKRKRKCKGPKFYSFD